MYVCVCVCVSAIRRPRVVLVHVRTRVLSIKGRALGRPEVQTNSKLSRARYQLSPSYLLILLLLFTDTAKLVLKKQV